MQDNCCMLRHTSLKTQGHPGPENLFVWLGSQIPLTVVGILDTKGVVTAKYPRPLQVYFITFLLVAN